MRHDKKLTGDLPSMNRAPQKKGFFRRIFPVLFIISAGALGFLIPALNKSESTASNRPPVQQQPEVAVPEPVYETKTFAVVKSNDLGYLNVRAEASTSSAKLGQLAIGDKVELIAVQGTWARVKLNTALQGKTEGWVAAEYIDQVTEKIQVN